MASENRPVWSSDVPISMPQPPDGDVLVPMFGFGMTQYGLVHDLTQGEYESLRTPSYTPVLPTDDIVYDDRDVDGR